MSLYNIVHGFNPLAVPLLESLGLYPITPIVDRFRDAALYDKDLERGQYLIRIITRTGGPNREAYQESIERLTKHELFVREEDDDWDNTYMYFFFNLPPSISEGLAEAVGEAPHKVRMAIDNMNMKEKSEIALKDL